MEGCDGRGKEGHLRSDNHEGPLGKGAETWPWRGAGAGVVRGREEMNIRPRPWPLLGPWAFSAESWAPRTVVGVLGTPEGLRCAPERTSLPTPSSCFLIRCLSPTCHGGGGRARISSNPQWKSLWGLLKWDAGKGRSPVGCACLEQVRERELGREGPRRPDGKRAGLLGREGTKGHHEWLRKGQWPWHHQARALVWFCRTPGVGLC